MTELKIDCFEDLLSQPVEYWPKLFPWKTFRKYQEPVIDAIIKGFRNKRYAILEGPTGSGKTVIALTLSRIFKDAFLATHQKMLQNQYMNDFSEYLAELKGRSNYPCLRINFKSWTVKGKPPTDDDHDTKNEYEEKGFYIRRPSENADYLSLESWEELDDDHIFKKHHCANAPCCTLSAEKGALMKQECKRFGVCEYIKVRDYALRYYPRSIMNFSNLLLFSLLMPKPYRKRSLLVLDEAHTFESFLYEYATIALTTRTLKPLLEHDDDDHVFRLTKPFQDIPALMAHIEDKLIPLIDLYLKSSAVVHGKNDVETAKGEDEFSKTENERDRMLNVKWKLTALLEEKPTEHSHVIIPETEMEAMKTKKTGLKLKPFSVAHLGPSLGFTSAWEGGKVLLMSATILDPKTFCKSLGIPQEDAFFIQMPSTFPPKNRLIIGDTTVGSMSYKNKEETLPKMCERIVELTDHFNSDKGIIHTGTYDIMSKFQRWAKKTHPDLYDRILFQTPGSFADKMQMLETHASSSEPLIICGPGFMEGIDLKDDLARFNLIMKLPFLSLADPLIKRKSEEFSEWYTLQMFLKIIQAIGRIVRSDTDHGITYILDLLWKWMYTKHKDQYVPPYIQEAIRWRTSRNMNQFP